MTSEKSEKTTYELPVITPEMSLAAQSALIDRLELEAVIARELSMFGSGVFAGTVLASLGGLLGPAGGLLRARLLDDRARVRRVGLARVGARLGVESVQNGDFGPGSWRHPGL